MINETFKIKDKDLDKQSTGFLQFLSTVSRHDDNRAAIHIPSKIWKFYNLKEVSKGYRPSVWLRDESGEYFVKSVFGNLNVITSKNSGRLILDLSLIPTDITGTVVEVTLRYKPVRIDRFEEYKSDSHSMTRKID